MFSSGVCGDLAPAGSENGRWGTAHGYLCESCPTNFELASGTTVTFTESVEARDSISALAVTSEATGSLTLTSSTISLENGITVELGGELSVVNGPYL